jgi:hypothetical protein
MLKSLYMKQLLKGATFTARELMRKAGYGEIRTKRGQISFAKRFGSDHFPRFHAYVEDVERGVQINLHIDQKQASYEGTAAHSGEYDGPKVEQEMWHIVQVAQGMMKPISPKSQPTQKKKGFFSGLFN